MSEIVEMERRHLTRERGIRADYLEKTVSIDFGIGDIGSLGKPYLCPTMAWEVTN